MSLILPGGPGFTYCQDNLDGVVAPSSSPGTAFTLGASSGDGSAVEIMQLTRDCHYLIVGFTSSAASTADNSALIDVMGDPTGGTSYTSPIIQDLAGWPGIVFGVSSGGYFWYHFPIWIKSGTAIAVLGRRNAAATLQYRCIMYAYGEPRRPDMWWCGQGVETLGANAGTSKGTTVTPGTSAWGSYTTLGTSTQRYGAIQMGVNGSDNSALSLNYYFQLGVGGQRIGTGTQWVGATNAEVLTRLGNWAPEFVDIPAGTTIQGRAYGNGTPEDHQMLAYGVY